MKIVGDPNRKLRSHLTKSTSAMGHYRANDLAREFGGIFIGEERGVKTVPVVATMEDFFPELAEEEEYLGRSNGFVPVEEFSTDEGLWHEDDGVDNDLPTDTLTEAFEMSFRPDGPASVVGVLIQHPEFLGVAYYMAREEKFWELFNNLPKISSWAVQTSSAERVIKILEGQEDQDGYDSLYSLTRAARIELSNQRSGKSDRGIAVGILQSLGFTTEEILRGKKRPAFLAAA